MPMTWNLLLLAVASFCGGLPAALAGGDAQALLEKVHSDVQQLADGLARENEKVREDVQQLADRLATESKKAADAGSREDAKNLLQEAKAEVQAVEKSAKSTAEHIQRLTDGLGSDDPQETYEIHTGAEIPWTAVWPCAIMVVLIYIYLAVGLFTPEWGYSRISMNRRDPALVLAALLYWVLMPIALVTLGFGATCEEGAPIIAYVIYGACFVMHFVCIFWAMAGSLKGQLHDSTPKLIFMLGLAALEHFDMASDALFTGMSAACSEQITSLWLQSWHEVPGGDLMVPVLGKMGFSGVALMLFVTAAYLPQLLCVPAPLAPFDSLAFVLMIIVWAAFGWLVGLTVMIAVYFAVVCTELGRPQIRRFTGQVAFDDSELVLFVGAEVVRLDQRAAEQRMMFAIGTKLVLENLLQLWLQSSYLSLSFETMDSFARWQAMASIGVGLLVAGGKGLQLSALLLPAVMEDPGYAWRNGELFLVFLGVIGVGMMLAGFGGLAWIVAKVVFVFRCESHVWNLTTGCVSPET